MSVNRLDVSCLRPSVNNRLDKNCANTSANNTRLDVTICALCVI